MTPPVPPGADPDAIPAAIRLRPFRRINIPDSHKPPVIAGSNLTPLNGRGYDCGCRASTDYDGKIGQDIGDEVARFVKIITGLIVVDRVLDVIGRLLGRIPIVGPAIENGFRKLIDEGDPLKNLFRKLGSLLDALLVDSLIRGVPSWVPAYRALNPAIQDIEQEIEGTLVRSYERYDSIPFTQWHAWYDWSFRVSPEPEFSKFVGNGNSGRNGQDRGVGDDVVAGVTRYDLDTLPPGGGSINQTVECEWDLGALGDDGPFLTPINPSALRDWAWPMTGAHFWATGRCIYDCSHATSDEKTGPDAGLHLNQIHPCKAIATARWEGVQFAENPLAVPAVQFMFFASRSQARAHPEKQGDKDLTFDTGGDFRFGPFSEDYEFEVELPPAPRRETEFPIGAVPGTLRNTIIPGPVLLQRVDVQNFLNANDEAGTHGIRPDIIPIRAANGGPPTRVKIRIPLSLMQASGDSSCGMIISLGWHDVARTLARRVFVVTVRLDRIVVTQKHDDFGDPEWRVNVGVNGRWLYYADGKEPGAGKDKDKTNEIGRNGSLALNRTVTLFLALDDTISVSVHGMEQDGLGDIMALPPDRQHGNVPNDAVPAVLKTLTTDFLSDRMLRGPAPVTVRTSPSQPPETIQVPFIGRPVEWRRDLDTAADTSARQKARASIVARAMFLRLATHALDANDPLGLIDPNVFRAQAFGRTNDATDTPNPLTVDAVIQEVGLGRAKQCQLTAYETEVIGRVANLVYHRDKIDYLIRYQVTVTAQS